MTTDDILNRYAEALFLTVEDGQLHGQAIALALRLAVQEAYAAGGALADDLAAIVASQAQPEPDQRVAESNQAQINRLNEWLEVNAPALYLNPDLDTAAAMLAAIATLNNALDDYRQQITQMDADNADLTQRLNNLAAVQTEAERLRQEIADLREQVIPDYQATLANTHRLLNNRMLELKELQAEVDRLTRENGIAVDTFNSLAERTNGAAAVGHVSNVTEPPVDWWASLDPETNDYRISLDAGRRKFREVPKQQRLLLVQAVARHIGGGQLPRQLEFDTHKPDWMPGGGGLAVTFCCNWSEMLTITPAEVAP